MSQRGLHSPRAIEVGNPRGQRRVSNIAGRYARAFLDVVILNHLRIKPMYGYELMLEIEHTCGLSVRSGALYPLLHQLEKGGLIAGKWHTGGRPTKTYTVTDRGMRHLKRTRDALRRLTEEPF